MAKTGQKEFWRLGPVSIWGVKISMFELFNPKMRVPAAFKAIIWVVLGWLAFLGYLAGSSAPAWI